MSETELTSKQKLYLGVMMDRLENYAEQMKPGVRISHDDVVRCQYGLQHAIFDLINQPPEDFAVLYPLALEFVLKHRQGVFHERYVFRFTEDMERNDAQTRHNFEDVVSLMMRTCDPAIRHLAIRQISLERLTRHLEDTARNNILAFYGV